MAKLGSASAVSPVLSSEFSLESSLKSSLESSEFFSKHVFFCTSQHGVHSMNLKELDSLLLVAAACNFLFLHMLKKARLVTAANDCFHGA